MSEIVVKIGDESGLITMGTRVDQNVVYPEKTVVGAVKDIAFDFGEVQMINSLGVRDFLNFLKAVREIEGMNITFQRCAPLVVKQMSMLPEFVENVTISSVLGPYFCEECDDEQLQLIELKDVTYEQIEGLVSGKMCSECEGPLEFDEPIASFFFYLKK